MQSYDFYHLFKTYNCNMQFGGDDQWSNMLGGTELIRKKLGKDAYATKTFSRDDVKVIGRAGKGGRPDEYIEGEQA